MKKYYQIKEFSQLTGVTVRTLDHYDKVGVLKPSQRSSSKYRLYSDEDRGKLHEISALAFIGYTLKEINEIMSRPNHNLEESLTFQTILLKRQSEQISQALQLTEKVLSELKKNNTINWDVFRGAFKYLQPLHESLPTWMIEYLTTDEQERYLKLIREIDMDFIHEVYYITEQNDIDCKKHLEKDPTSDPTGEIGQQFAKRCTDPYKQFCSEAGDWRLMFKLWHAAIENIAPVHFYHSAGYEQKISNYLYQASLYFCQQKGFL